MNGIEAKTQKKKDWGKRLLDKLIFRKPDMFNIFLFILFNFVNFGQFSQCIYQSFFVFLHLGLFLQIVFADEAKTYKPHDNFSVNLHVFFILFFLLFVTLGDA